MSTATHSFAGFTYPRPFPFLPAGKPAARLASRRRTDKPFRGITGGYYLTGAQRDRGAALHSFYLEDMGMPAPRYALAHEVPDARVRHSGWYLDDHCDETVCGVVFYLSGGRMVAGWTLGVGMASAIDATTVYDCPREAAAAADDMAQRYAEAERDYRASEDAASEESAMME